MSEVIRPYADLSGIFTAIEYRANAVDPFQMIEVDENVATTIVRVDDLRTIPQHQLRVHFDWDALKPQYEKHKDKLKLIVIARDSTLRRELRLVIFR